MLPILVASYLNATFSGSGAVSRAALLGQTTVIAGNEWASANPATCNLMEETGAAPAAGDTGCTASHGEGAIAWSTVRFCQDKDDWLLYCTGDTWTASDGKTMSEFDADQKWAIVPPNEPNPWLGGTHISNTALHHKCDDTNGYRNAGGVFICVEAMKNGNLVAAICQKGDATTGTPACATDFSTLQLNGGEIFEGGSGDCPMQSAPTTYAEWDDE